MKSNGFVKRSEMFHTCFYLLLFVELRLWTTHCNIFIFQAAIPTHLAVSKTVVATVSAFDCITVCWEMPHTGQYHRPGKNKGLQGKGPNKSTKSRGRCIALVDTRPLQCSLYQNMDARDFDLEQSALHPVQNAQKSLAIIRSGTSHKQHQHKVHQSSKTGDGSVLNDRAVQ